MEYSWATRIYPECVYSSSKFALEGPSESGNKKEPPSNKSLEKTIDLTNSTTKQLENIERENRLSAILRLHTRGLNQEQIAKESIYSK